MIRTVSAAALAFPLALVAAILPASAQGERILAFSSDITIGRDGRLNVRESISVEAEGREISRGIMRDFPTIYREDTGERRTINFAVARVMRDGEDENFVVENIANGKSVRIGNADVFLQPGRHDYTIEYTTDRQIGFFPDHDELYWNVTGFWPFAIDQTEATVHLPEGAKINLSDFFTGPQGAVDKNGSATTLNDTTIRFVASALAPNEGLTVAVGFNKGVVVPPSAVETATGFLADNGSVIVAWGGVVALFAFYGMAWLRVGRDPARGVVVPLFAPPKGFSAPATRFVHRMSYDRKAFSAALVSMAVKGYLKISENSDVYTVKRTGKSDSETQLAAAERALGGALFQNAQTITLKNDNHRAVSRAIVALKQALNSEAEGVYFVTNRGWFFAGIILIAASAAASAYLSEQPQATAFVLVSFGLLSLLATFLVAKMASAWRGVISATGSRIWDFSIALAATLRSAPFILVAFAAIFVFDHQLPIPATVGLVAQGILAVVFFYLLKAPTAGGAKIRDQIDGFGMFLTTAERDRLEILHPPEITPEVFEKFLPYAIALDAENEWSRKFEAAAARAGQAPGDTGYSPSWYSGSRRFSSSSFSSSLGSGLAAATAAAASPPGRSSGVGGGGFSGGGGGGGGGRGW